MLQMHILAASCAAGKDIQASQRQAAMPDAMTCMVAQEEAGSPSFANAPLGGDDELEKLTQQLDDQITKDAWRPKVTVQQPTFGQTTTEAAKDDFDKFVQRAADTDDESVYSADLGRQESGQGSTGAVLTCSHTHPIPAGLFLSLQADSEPRHMMIYPHKS